MPSPDRARSIGSLLLDQRDFAKITGLALVLGLSAGTIVTVAASPKDLFDCSFLSRSVTSKLYEARIRPRLISGWR